MQAGLEITPMRLAEMRRAQLEQLALAAPAFAYLAGSHFGMVLLVKGERGAAEEAGGPPFSGADGEALSSALERLGWGANNWCGLLLAPLGRPALAEEGLLLLIETLDPTVVVVSDGAARKAFCEAYAGRDGAGMTLEAFGETTIQGRRHVCVGEFEQGLASEDAKQRAWLQLKKLDRSRV